MRTYMKVTNAIKEAINLRVWGPAKVIQEKVTIRGLQEGWGRNDAILFQLKILKINQNKNYQKGTIRIIEQMLLMKQNEVCTLQSTEIQKAPFSGY